MRISDWSSDVCSSDLIALDPKDPGVNKLVEEVKAREFEGFAYDGAEASFELLARRARGEVPSYFSLTRFRIMDDRLWNARAALRTESEATVTLEVAGCAKLAVADGKRPGNVLDHRLPNGRVHPFP